MKQRDPHPRRAVFYEFERSGKLNPAGRFPVCTDEMAFYTYSYVHLGEEKAYPAPGLYTTLEFACDAADAEMREWATGYSVLFEKPKRVAIAKALQDEDAVLYGSVIRNREDGVIYSMEIVRVLK